MSTSRWLAPPYLFSMGEDMNPVFYGYERISYCQMIRLDTADEHAKH